MATHGGQNLHDARTQQDAAHRNDPQTEAEKINRREKSLDDALNDSFPASDTPSALAPHRLQK